MTQRTPHPLTKLTRRMLPFADAASRDLPIGQLLRLSLFQISVGLASVMLLGTLNRVMIVELSVPAMIVAIMIALPVLIAPFRALIGFRSDTYRSVVIRQKTSLFSVINTELKVLPLVIDITQWDLNGLME